MQPTTKIIPAAKLTEFAAEYRNALMLKTLREVKTWMRLTTPYRLILDIDLCIGLLDRSVDCDGIDTAREVYGDVSP